jgi:hypothetical protein
MYNIQDYSVIYNNAAHLVICEGRVYKTNLILPLFIEVPASSLESERSCICVLEVSILSLFLWFSIRFSSVFFVQSNYVVSFSFLWRYSLGHVMKLLTVQIIWGQDTQTTWGTIHITKTNKTKTTPKTMSIHLRIDNYYRRTSLIHTNEMRIVKQPRSKMSQRLWKTRKRTNRNKLYIETSAHRWRV